MWWSFFNLFKRKGPTQRLKTAKKSIFSHFFLFKIKECGVSRALPCDDWSLRNLFKLKGPTQQLKMAKKSILLPFWTANPIFWPFWAAEWVPWVWHVMSGPYATFSNPTDSISGSECLYFERKKVTKNLDVGSKMAVKLISWRNFSNS